MQLGIPTRLERFQRLHNLLLRKPGFVPTDWRIVPADLLEFQLSGSGTFMVRIDEADPTYFELLFPYFARRPILESDEYFLRACNLANVQSKLAKVFIWEDAAYCVVQAQADSERDFMSSIDRYISAIHAGVRNFMDQLERERRVATK